MPVKRTVKPVKKTVKPVKKTVKPVKKTVKPVKKTIKRGGWTPTDQELKNGTKNKDGTDYPSNITESYFNVYLKNRPRPRFDEVYNALLPLDFDSDEYGQQLEKHDIGLNQEMSVGLKVSLDRWKSAVTKHGRDSQQAKNAAIILKAYDIPVSNWSKKIVDWANDLDDARELQTRFVKQGKIRSTSQIQSQKRIKARTKQLQQGIVAKALSPKKITRMIQKIQQTGQYPPNMGFLGLDRAM